MKMFIIAITAAAGLSLSGLTGQAEASHGRQGHDWHRSSYSSYCYRPCYDYSCYDYSCYDDSCYNWNCYRSDWSHRDRGYYRDSFKFRGRGHRR